MQSVKDVAASAFELEVLLREQTSRVNTLNEHVRLFGETQTARELSNGIALSPGVMSRAAETLRMIEEFLQDGPPQHEETDYIYRSYDLLYGNEVIEPSLRGGGSFIVCPFGALCLGNYAPWMVHRRWDILDAEMITIAAKEVSTCGSSTRSAEPGS